VQHGKNLLGRRSVQRNHITDAATPGGQLPVLSKANKSTFGALFRNLPPLTRTPCFGPPSAAITAVGSPRRTHMGNRQSEGSRPGADRQSSPKTPAAKARDGRREPPGIRLSGPQDRRACCSALLDQLNDLALVLSWPTRSTRHLQGTLAIDRPAETVRLPLCPRECSRRQHRLSTVLPFLNKSVSSNHVTGRTMNPLSRPQLIDWNLRHLSAIRQKQRTVGLVVIRRSRCRRARWLVYVRSDCRAP